MSRRVVAAIGVAALAMVLVPQVAGGSGGGACPPPITNGTQTRALIKDFCYDPTVIHVRPGASVTWINKDSQWHTITGANRAWGTYKPLKRNEEISYRFNRAGVYPFYCTAHVGMVGTVVVRDGLAPKALDRKAASEAVDRVRLKDATAASAQLPAQTKSGQSLSWTWMGAGVAALAGLVVGARRAMRNRGS